MLNKKILLICGTRPEIIKMAPVWNALRQTPGLTPILLHTGQHTDLAQPLYEFFDMPPTVSLELTRKNPSLAHLTALLLEEIAAVVQEQKPDAVLVLGDTSSAVAGAMAAFFEKIPVGHVEAGLRTNDKYSPFPEEMNRCVIGRVAQWHYAPTSRAREFLLTENIADKDILVTGNTVIDAALLTAGLLAEGHPVPFWDHNALDARLNNKKLVLVTAHRRENWGQGLEHIAHATCDLIEANPAIFVVWPLHANPDVAQTVRGVFAQRNIGSSNLLLCAALDYSALVKVLTRAWLVMTDSGGIQEEAAAFGRPVLVLRESTERPELIEAGGGVLTGANRAVILDRALALLNDPARYAAMTDIVNPFGNGTAGAQIAAQLALELVAPDIARQKAAA